MTILLVMVLLSISILTACETNTPQLLRPEEIAMQVGDTYGEPHAQVAKVMSTVADAPPHDPMYLMTLTGRFHKGALEAQTLSFSALANKMYIWDIHAYDQAGMEVWFDRELAAVPDGSCSRCSEAVPHCRLGSLDSQPQPDQAPYEPFSLCVGGLGCWLLLQPGNTIPMIFTFSLAGGGKEPFQMKSDLLFRCHSKSLCQ
jgi:hypothetical protein